MTSADERAAGVHRFADRACDWAVLAFALWTLCVHAAVPAELGLHALMLLAGTVGLAAAGIGWWRRGRRPATPPEATPRAESESESTPPRWSRVAIAVGAAACALAASMNLPLLAVWAVATSLIAAVAAREAISGSAGMRRTKSSTAATPVLLLLAVGCAVATLGAHRPDVDDGFYVNLAVAAVDDPDAPVLAKDTLHGVPNVPLALPVYRAHSIELLEAAIARLTGQSVLDIAHLWLPALAALLVPFVYARSLRVLLPGAWIWGVAVALGWMLFTATASHGWANFGLVRLHQGKGLLLTVALPLTLAYALEFARRGGTRAWLRLAAAQIGAVGLSASALWLAPAVAAPALLAGIPRRAGGASSRRLLAGLAASGYVLVVALALRAATTAAFRDAAVPSPAADLSSLELANQALRTVLGPGVGGAMAIFAVVGAWSFARDAVTRRLCAFSALMALLLWNPLIAQWIAAQLTSAPAYWRVLWLLPMPLLVAVIVTAPIVWRPSGLGRAACAVAALAVFGLGVGVAPRAFVLSPANVVRFGTPGWKVPASAFDAARAIAAAAGPDERVLAPRLVAPWIPTFHHHPAPLVVRIEYLPVLYEKLGATELERRVNLMRLVSGGKRPPRAEALLRSATHDDRLAVVCLANAARRWDDIVAVLRDAGFQIIHRNTEYVVWARSGTPGEGSADP